MVLYRGLSPFEGVEFKRGRLLVRPRAPLRANAHDWLTFEGFADCDVLRLLHVLEHVRQHAVSFTATKHVGDYYATSLDVNRQFVRKGLVGEVKLPDLLRAVGIANAPPAVHVFCDGTAWLDPRTLVGQTHLQEQNFLECLTMQHRAQVDDELLLVHGAVLIRTAREALPGTLPVQHGPWKAVEDLRGIALREELDLDEDDDEDDLFGPP